MSDDEEDLLRDLGLRDCAIHQASKPQAQLGDELFDLTSSPEALQPEATHPSPPLHRWAGVGHQNDEQGEGSGHARGQRKRQRPQYLASYDEGQTFDASQQDCSQPEAAVQQSPTFVPPDEPRRISPPMPASAPQNGSDLAPDSPLRPQKRRARGKTAEERAEAAAGKELEKQEKKAARERAKQEKAAQKEEEKQRKAQERLDRQRENGKSALEDILPVLCPAAMNHATTLRIMERLIADEFRYEVNMGHPLPLGAPDSGLRSIVWKRRVHRRYSDGERSQASQAVDGDGEAPQHEDVPYVLVYITGEELVAMLEKDTLDNFLARVAAAHAGSTLGLLIEGLHSYLKKRQNADYRRLGPGGGGFSAAGYEEVLARLTVDQPGVRHRCVADAAAAADHVSQLTKALATQPFKVQDSFLHQFGGSGKGTANVKATLARYPLRSRSLEPWYHALSYVVDINPGQAHAIVHQHPSLGQLMAIYADPARSQREKENLVADLKYVGGSTRVGPKASQRLFALFTATDPLLPLGDLGFNG